MNRTELRLLLENVKDGSVNINEAILALKKAPYADLEYAKVDLHRGLRQGTPEVIYGAGKTKEHILGICKTMLENGQKQILVTRIDEEVGDYLSSKLDITYHKIAKVGIVGDIPQPNGIGKVVIATGGTSDMPVAEEAALTAELLGNEVVRLYDVGVAGLHRLLSHMDEIMSARVIVAIAGMEGALPSVIGGLADCPVIGVPTSVGYGTSLGGVTALLSMLNSCSSGVSVVNIDNGFGAAYLANMINHD
ncbi:nickel pincer cofactor biosynthesis protein LarB [Ignavigranum ruoffiae]|uniref:nickel pincer cofactor biosynthesis protein LarB n=1 Tax=Ignavigranum ruoffiae TaxID=89093 RepID=UPI0024ADB7C3|nr:nickel pincer cofactor biosynthesis protein LarB [Ignavigranum ruoffiae]